MKLSLVYIGTCHPWNDFPFILFLFKIIEKKELETCSPEDNKEAISSLFLYSSNLSCNDKSLSVSFPIADTTTTTLLRTTPIQRAGATSPLRVPLTPIILVFGLGFLWLPPVVLRALFSSRPLTQPSRSWFPKKTSVEPAAWRNLVTA